MANRLLDLASAGGWVEETLWANERWGAWVNSYLKDRNEIEGLGKWLCGRPSAQAPGGSNSDDDLNKDFDMSAMSNSLGLSRDVYNRYGNSAGNDDDWDEEADEEVGFRSAALLATSNNNDVREASDPSVFACAHAHCGRFCCPRGVDLHSLRRPRRCGDYDRALRHNLIPHIAKNTPLPAPPRPAGRRRRG